MIPHRKNLDGFAISLMLLLCLCWGLQQVAVKLAIPVIGASMQLGLRSGLAAALVLLLIFIKKIPISLRDRHVLPGIAAGILFALEFLCVSLGLKYTTASHMSVFLYTAPIFTVLGLHWLIPAERLQAAQWLGILSAFAGVAIAFSGAFVQSPHELGEMLIGDGLGVLGAILWAATTITVRKSSLSEAEPTTTLFYQLAVGALILLAFVFLRGENLPTQWDRTSIISLFFQAVIVAFASFLTWFWLMRRYLVSRLSVFSFLTPLFGVAAGVILMHDPISPRFALGAILVCGGIVLVNFRRT
ncbi:DMT family transporter [Undibacterium sp. TS12]|uniref:DMT family transporter n=1 Tax=Undibacterium sp. TS12 TaxID=2908202 RepID=UPI001F4CEAAE|nr:DMT family transporter [Undibacterium sp. TS12]MCH8617533.1 DMT family transporter [Undibacterium sp. TS12]